MDSGGMGPGGCAKWHDERQRSQLLSRRHSPCFAHVEFEASMKTKPDQVIVHRIEMQQKEREIAEGLAFSMMAKNYLSPLVGVMGSPLALATIVGLWVAYLTKYLGGGWLEQNWDATVEEVKDWLEPQNLVVGGLGAIIGAIIGLPFGGVGAVAGAAIGGVAGGAVVEGVEYITEEGPAWATPEEAAKNREAVKRHALAMLIVTTIGAKKFVDEAVELKEWVTGGR